MNWLDYLRGYDEGKCDGSRYAENKQRSIMVSLLIITINLVMMTLKLAHCILHVAMKLLMALLRVL